jgi:thioredoxin reductase
LYDVLIVGGGPAGLSAALVLGRCRRRVLVFDSGQPRNAAAQAMHGYLSRDGIPPRELLRLGRDEVARYGVEIQDTEVDSARIRNPDDAEEPGAAFEVETAEGRRFLARKLLLATGVRDILPPIAGGETYYGRGVHHCPYCDGWEHRDQALVAYGDGSAAVGLALALRTWSSRVTACTDGTRIGLNDRERLERNGIGLRTGRIARLDGADGVLQRVVFRSGPPLDCDALFFNTGQVQRSLLPTMLGCETGENDQIRTHDRQRTCQPGLFLAGDADGDVQFVIAAAAEGARAAVAINRELQDEDRGEARPPRRATGATVLRKS